MFQAVSDASVDNGSASVPTLSIHCDTSGTKPPSWAEEGRWHGDHCTAPLLPTHHTSTHPNNPANIRPAASTQQWTSIYL